MFLDCEHFFDGYRFDRDYGVRVAEAAVEAGADVVVMCDTNGGMLPMSASSGSSARCGDRTGFRLGIHCQDDTGCAVANTVAAVQAGATHVQCTANGYGERAGNADLFAVVGNLTTKMGLPVLPDGALAEMMRVSHALAELANIAPNTHQAYVGLVRVLAQGGAARVARSRSTRSCTTTSTRPVVGNDMHILITEMAGRASVELKARELGVDLAGQPEAVGRIVDTVKDREAAGWSYEAADASFELLVRDETRRRRGRMRRRRGPFRLESYRVIVENTARRGDHPRRRSRCTSAASGSSPPPRATARSTRWTRRCAAPSPSSTRSSTRSSWSTTRCASWPGSAGTDSITRVLVVTRRRGGRGVDHRRRARQRRRGVLAGAGGRAGLRAAAVGSRCRRLAGRRRRIRCRYTSDTGP